MARGPSFAWLKPLSPRGLYGRAALILIVPIVTIQIVVSIAFVQRYFEDVTRQLTQNLVIDLAFLERQVAAAPDAEAAGRVAAEIAAGLHLQAQLPGEGPLADDRVFYDFSGRVVIATLRASLPRLGQADLSDLRTVVLGFDTDHGPMRVSVPRKRVSPSNPHQFLVLMGATGALMTLVAYLFLRNQLRPIRRLAEAAEAFGKGRNITYRPTGAVEVRAAGHAFLDMRARIERQIEQRTLMLSGVSHDLRTPLTRLKLSLALLDEDDEVRAMLRDVDEMQMLLDAFLSFARGDARDEDAEAVDPIAMVNAVIEDARRAGRPVTLAAVEGEGTARLRIAAVRRALDNLIGNAVRYGRRAEVSVAILERSVRITVEDDGPGIPKERREEAMRPFTRLDAARNQDRGSGVGLGLTIAADIARSHGGALRLGDSARLGGLKAELVLAR